MLDYQDRVGNLNLHIANGTLIRHDWGDGHERACLLAAMSPEVAESTNPDSCPAEVMPPWLAQLTVDFDDNGSDAAWPGMVRRYANLASRWHVLSPEGWDHAFHAVVAEVESLDPASSYQNTNSTHPGSDRLAIYCSLQLSHIASNWNNRQYLWDRLTTAVFDIIETEILNASMTA